MNRSELNEKARKYLSDAGFGTGTNITLHGAMCLMVDFYLDNQVKKFDIQSVVPSTFTKRDLQDAWIHGCIRAPKEHMHLNNFDDYFKAKYKKIE